MMLLLVLVLMVPSFAQATTYWASTSGGSTNCAAIDGDADPSTYGLPDFAIGCMASGDTVRLKAGTYTSSINWSGLPSGSASTLSTIQCDGDRTCIIRHAAPSGTLGVITLNRTGGDKSYVQLGGIGHGFDVDAVNCGSTQCKGIYVLYASTINRAGISIIGNRVRNHHSDGISLSRHSTAFAYTDIVIEHNTVEQATTPLYYSQGPPHALYIKANSGLVRHNTATAAGDNEGGNTWGVHCYLPCNNITISHNVILVPGPSRGILTQQGNDNLIYRNFVQEISGTSPYCISSGQSSGGNRVFHNTCDGFDTFYLNASTAGSGNQFRNNACVTGTSCTIDDAKGDLAQSNNSTGVATNQFTDRANADYTLVAGSALIDAGGVISGFPYNGSAPDRGASETFGFASCEVPSDATSTVRVTFTNDAHPPLLPATGATTFTVRKNGASNAVSGSVDRSGDGIFVIPVTNSYAGGDTVDISLSTNNITDSALIGGDANQPYVGTLTNQSCTNNAAGAPVHTFTQAAFELHDWLGDEASPVILPYGFASTGAAENFANYKVRKGGKIRIRFSIICGVANCPPTAFNLHRSTGGAYSALTDSFGVSGGFKFCGEVPGTITNGGPTTNQLSTAGTFVAGGIMYTASAIPTISGLNTGYKTELEYCIDVRDIASTGNVDFRVYQQDGTALDTYTVTPRIVIDEISAGAN